VPFFAGTRLVKDSKVAEIDAIQMKPLVVSMITFDA
jgi:hypothetical protein